MWVKVADREEIAKFEITPQANKVTSLIGETPDSFMASEDDLGLMLLCKVPLKISSLDIQLEDDAEINLECWQYEGQNSHLIFSKSGFTGILGLNTIPCDIMLSPGKYFLRVISRGILLKNTTKISTSHHFLSVVGGSSVTNDLIPDYQELLNPTVWFGIYNIQIQVANKSLYLGITDDLLNNDDLILGAFYHCIKSGSLTMYVFDGTQQYSK